MTKIQRFLFYLIFVILTILVFIAIYLSSILNRTKSEVKNVRPAILQIQQLVPSLDKKYKTKRYENDLILDKFIYNLKTHDNANKKHANESFLWKVAKTWLSSSTAQLYDMKNPDVGNLLNALKTAKIVKADIDLRGTQLKLLLTLEGDQKAIFKPKWYPIDKVIRGPVYAGKDRYGSEIVAFYLSAILKKPLAPLAIDRNISLSREILPVASDRLKATIFKNEDKFCVYGKCFYCSKEDPVCEDENENLTGAIILNVDANFKHNRSPWQRTYKNGKVALWEVRDDYCDGIKLKLSRHRLLDLIDVSIFDFLLQNGDRHHYETLHDNIVFLDNGKGLGNPNVHHMDILAPLYQCCMLRNSTRKRLEQLSGGYLTEKLESMPNIFTFITKSHLYALEERLVIIYAAINYCATIK